MQLNPLNDCSRPRKKFKTLIKSGHISIRVVEGGPATVEPAGTSYQLAKSSGCKNIQVEIFAGKKLMKDFFRYNQTEP